ncbi:hypothetical protein GCM10023116_03010 [Kistimonas scapharcae]|uniref:PsbP C-terminal domain-containing protein n=1 Tax=Kistimonas scapharcae TaxID=1036133 RepID=A0ABP8UW97_9GAMM
MRCKGIVFVFIIVASLLQFQSAYAAKPPKGYQWEACEFITCSFLVPDGWAFERLENNNTVRFVITKRRHKQPLAPRVRVNVLQQAESRTGIPAERHLDLFMKDLYKSSRVLETWQRKGGAFKSVAATAIHYTNANNPTQQFNLLIANVVTGTLYVMSFEAVPEFWDQEWIIVEQIFEQLRLDERV